MLAEQPSKWQSESVAFGGKLPPLWLLSSSAPAYAWLWLPLANAVQLKKLQESMEASTAFTTMMTPPPCVSNHVIRTWWWGGLGVGLVVLGVGLLVWGLLAAHRDNVETGPSGFSRTTKEGAEGGTETGSARVSLQRHVQGATECGGV